ncbi:hypothetical protein SeMB42_g01644 [Synchytrium endobioticum]|uniref:Uncharacterized protein n=1 Tax=Synchytrium endobioticum TaxID=286115 RepID=A0A507CN38_9FUNG|nr:hypothetical protein SeLEV6574_g06559 [Synchytrium endobioticum]TPX52084.1 hypothetical protein SeMB42_g01644 [Synchytrium endobioticum]
MHLTHCVLALSLSLGVCSLPTPGRGRSSNYVSNDEIEATPPYDHPLSWDFTCKEDPSTFLSNDEGPSYQQYDEGPSYQKYDEDGQFDDSAVQDTYLQYGERVDTGELGYLLDNAPPSTPLGSLSPLPPHMDDSMLEDYHLNNGPYYEPVDQHNNYVYDIPTPTDQAYIDAHKERFEEIGDELNNLLLEDSYVHQPDRQLSLKDWQDNENYWP